MFLIFEKQIFLNIKLNFFFVMPEKYYQNLDLYDILLCLQMVTSQNNNILRLKIILSFKHKKTSVFCKNSKKYYNIIFDTMTLSPKFLQMNNSRKDY